MTVKTLTPQKKRGLGKGLSHLLSETHHNLENSTSTEQISYLPVEKLESGKYQPRENFSAEALQDLAESIRTQGILQPIIARKLPGELIYEILAGERRYRAAILAGLSEVPVIIRNIPDKSALAIALIENIQRENLNAIEEAQALKRLQSEFQLTQQQIAEAVGKSRVGVTHLLRLLELHPRVQTSLKSGEIEKGHAKVLAALPHSAQERACEWIISQKLSVRETEKILKNPSFTGGSLQPHKPPKKIDPNVSSLEKQLSDKLSTPVIIQHHPNKRGKLIIHYRNLDVLQKIFEKLTVS